MDPHGSSQVHKPLEDTVQAVKPGKTQGHYLRRGKDSAGVWYNNILYNICVYYYYLLLLFF